MLAKDELLKSFAIGNELETSSKLIKLGFGELQNLNQSNDFYFLPFQLLSQGFERLMKIYICLGHLETHGNYPKFEYIKNDLGHKLDTLLKVILTEYFNEKDSQVLTDDRNFLQYDTDLKELLGILSKFGDYARYYNIDVITKIRMPHVDPKDLWIRFENRVLFSNPQLVEKLTDWELNKEVSGQLSRYILVILERFVSAISRQIFLGALGENAKRYSGSVFEFAMLYEREFGNKDYRKDTTNFKRIKKKAHKRTIFDKLRRKYNSNDRHKRITKEEYDGDWPFYEDKVIIECREKKWCIITIGRYDYALNNSARRRYKLEDPLEAGMTIPGKSTSDFISMAFDLWND